MENFNRAYKKCIRIFININSMLFILNLLLVIYLAKRKIGGDVEHSIKMMEIMSLGDFSNRIDSKSKDNLLYVMESLRLNICNTTSQLQERNAEMLKEINELSISIAEIKRKNEERKMHINSKDKFMVQMDKFFKKNGEASQVIAKNIDLSCDSLSLNKWGIIEQVRLNIAQIRKNSERSEDIFTVLDSLSFQTHVLALNTSVEASIAGEDGQSLSVLAREARMLVNQLAESVKEVKIIISENLMKIRECSRQVDQTVMAIHDVLDMVRNMASLAAEIGASTAEQGLIISNSVDAENILNKLNECNRGFINKAAPSVDGLNVQFSSIASLLGLFNIKNTKKILNTQD